MKIVFRGILFLLVLCLLAGLVATLSLLMPIPWLSSNMQTWLAQYPWLNVALAVVLLFFAAASVLALVLLVSVPTRRKLFIVPQEMGKIEITRQSIESAATASLGNIHEVKRFHVHTRGNLRPGKLKLAVEFEPRDSRANLPGLGSVVQHRLAEDLAGCLAIDPKHIKVKITPVDAQSQDRRTHPNNVPRVV